MKDYIAVNKQAYSNLASQYKSRISEYEDTDKVLLKPFIAAINAQFDNPRILELGPGSGLALRMFEGAGFHTTAVEFSPEIIEVAKETSPHTTFICNDFLIHDFGLAHFEGIFAKAFIHLFPKNDALKVLNKVHSLTSQNGLFFLATTVHESSSEGYEEKDDYVDSPMRYRKKWTESELLEVLMNKWKVIHKSYDHERGKYWIALVLEKV